MSAERAVTRAIDACRRAGLPIIKGNECTCSLRGRLVVLDGPEGLRVLWPYDGRCLVHGPRDREGLGQPISSGKGDRAPRPRGMRGRNERAGAI